MAGSKAAEIPWQRTGFDPVRQWQGAAADRHRCAEAALLACAVQKGRGCWASHGNAVPAPADSAASEK
ncbi:hypothetical protein SAMCCGM7_pB0362 (plasmid) [Sinorhizobium americanum CCGM7]|nr:hypothetical protein SAMCCGM7_pB0362 [Sinorhizobium americanum CCGM7]